MKFDNDIQFNKKDIEKELKLPNKMSCELAEIAGIHFGDGNMQIKDNRSYGLLYSCNLAEKKYALYIASQFKKLFNVSPTIYERKERSSIELYFYSKTLCEFFNKKIKIPYSPKKDLTIPDYIQFNKGYLKFFLRGLFDTDGCTTIQIDGKYRYPLIKITSKFESFAKDINFALTSLNIKSYICKKSPGYDVVIRKKESFCRFMELIKPKNKKGM